VPRATSKTQQKEPVPISRIERKKQERTKKLIRAAAEVFSEKGYDKTSLGDVAERLDMRAPSLYHYVQTKDDLFIRCADEMLNENFAQLEEARDSQGSPIERLERMLQVRILGQFGEFYPNHVPLFISVTSTEPSLMAYIKSKRKQHVKYFWELAYEAAAVGELKGKKWELGLRLAAGLLGSLHHRYDPKNKLQPEKMAAEIAASLMTPITD